ncbi:hypothetical protein JHK85_014634 [Glycine max]|nr:hypothetical protein JHK85_014634 [Glycine max]
MSSFQVWSGFLLALSLLNSRALVYSHPTPNSPSHPPQHGDSAHKPGCYQPTPPTHRPPKIPPPPSLPSLSPLPPGAFYFFSPPPPSPPHYPKTQRPVGLGPPPPRFRINLIPGIGVRGDSLFNGRSGSIVVGRGHVSSEST